MDTRDREKWRRWRRTPATDIEKTQELFPMNPKPPRLLSILRIRWRLFKKSLGVPERAP